MEMTQFSEEEVTKHLMGMFVKQGLLWLTRVSMNQPESKALLHVLTWKSVELKFKAKSIELWFQERQIEEWQTRDWNRQPWSSLLYLAG